MASSLHQEVLGKETTSFSHSMFLVNQHNCHIHLDRVDHKGVLKAQYEAVDELVNVDIDIRPAVNDVSDLIEYQTFENFTPPDTLRDIIAQKALPMTEICVALPLKNQWQHLEEVATHGKAKQFIANPSVSPVDDSNMTANSEVRSACRKRRKSSYFSYADKQEVATR